ncbi:MAG: hypothetical protein ACXWG7_05490 [Chthoniobacterales bacterium]
MSFNSTLVGGGGGFVIPASLPQADSPATAIIVLTRLLTRANRIDIDLIMMFMAVLTKPLFALGIKLYPQLLSAL